MCVIDPFLIPCRRQARNLCNGDVARVCVCEGVGVCVCVFVTLLVNTISQVMTGLHFSYLVYSFVMLRGRTLLFLAMVKGHLRSPEVKNEKPCKHDLSS